MKTTWKAVPWEDAPFMCRIFGHKTSSKYPEYGKATYKTTDCIGRIHMNYVHRCDRCGNKGITSYFHLYTALSDVPKYMIDEIKLNLTKQQSLK